MSDLIGLLERLCGFEAPSGREREIRNFLLDEIGQDAQCSVDALGNIIALKKGKNPAKRRVMLDAHMDEVGFVITTVSEDGLLRFSPVGGIDPHVVLGRQVRVQGGITGVIGCVPTHLLTEDTKNHQPKLEELFIDIGAASRQEALNLVQPGDAAFFYGPFERFGEGKIKARALDDRCGCAILLDMIHKDQPYDLTFTFTVQEEIGLNGAKTAAYGVAPDAAIVVEATTAADVAMVDKMDEVCGLGGGTAVSFQDSHTLYDPELYSLAFAVAKEHGIPCQAKEAVAGGNNAGAIHSSRAGVKTLALSVPCRYLHSAACVIDQADLEATRELVELTAAAVAGQA